MNERDDVTLENQKPEGEEPRERFPLEHYAKNILIDVEDLTKRAYANKKISKSEGEIRNIIKGMNQFIWYFNSLDEMRYSAFRQNISFDSINVPKEFADFIIPASVRRDSTNLRCKNLITLETNNDKMMEDAVIPAQWDYLSYVNLCDEWRSIFKKDMSVNTVKLSEIKKHVTTESVIDRLASEVGGSDKVRYSGEPFVPLKLNYVGQEFEERYFTNSVTEVMTDWYANFKF